MRVSVRDISSGVEPDSVSAMMALVDKGLLKDGDRVLLTKGDFTGPGGTNEMKILKVGDAIAV